MYNRQVFDAKLGNAVVWCAKNVSSSGHHRKVPSHLDG